MKNSFILHLDSLSILDEMNNEQKGILFDAIYKFNLGEEVKLDFAMKMAFTQFKNQFIRDNEKYNSFTEKQKMNGAKGGHRKHINNQVVIDNPSLPKPTQAYIDEPKPTQTTQAYIDEPKLAYSVSVSVSDSVNVNVNENNINIIPPKEKPFDFLKSVIGLGVDEITAKTWMKVRKDKKLTNSEIAFNGIVSEINQTEAAAQDIITLCVIKSWGGYSRTWIKDGDLRRDKKLQTKTPQQQKDWDDYQDSIIKTSFTL